MSDSQSTRRRRERGRATHASGVLPTSVRRVHQVSGPPSEVIAVYCPKQGASLSIEECSACCHCLTITRLEGTGGPTVTCALGMGASVPLGSDDEPSITGAELTTPVSTVMSRSVVCVRPEMSVEALHLVLVESSVGGVPVVDAHGKPVGIVSKTDLVWEGYDRAEAIEEDEPIDEVPRRQRVAEIMSKTVFVVRENASIVEAAAAMAREGIRRLPVIDKTGVVVGIVSALDIVGWLARSAGYETEPRGA